VTPSTQPSQIIQAVIEWVEIHMMSIKFKPSRTRRADILSSRVLEFLVGFRARVQDGFVSRVAVVFIKQLFVSTLPICFTPRFRLCHPFDRGIVLAADFSANVRRFFSAPTRILVDLLSMPIAPVSLYTPQTTKLVVARPLAGELRSALRTYQMSNRIFAHATMVVVLMVIAK
jgi:hypothetical protein